MNFKIIPSLNTGINIRKKILKTLDGEELTTKEIAERIKLDRHRIEHHLGKLWARNKINCYKSGLNKIWFKGD